MLGLMLNGYVSERFGYRYTVIACLVLVAAFTTIFFTAQNVEALLAAEILCGIPWGMTTTTENLKASADSCIVIQASFRLLRSRTPRKSVLWRFVGT